MKIISIGLGFITSLILARTLRPEQYGAYVYALAWVNLLVVPVVLGLDKLMIRNVSIFEAEQQWSSLRGIRNFSNRIVLGLGISVAAVVLLVTYFYSEYFDDNLIEPLQISVVLIPLIALTRLRTAVMIGLRHVVQGTFPETVLRPILFIAFILFSYYILDLSPDAQTTVILNICAVIFSFAVGVILLNRVIPAGVGQVAPNYLPAIWVNSALPLALLAGLQIINARIDIIMLGAMLGAADVAIYNVVYQGGMLASFVLVAAGGVISPLVARMYAQGEKQKLQRLVTSSSRAVFVATLPIALVIIVFGSSFLGLFGEQYVNGYSALVVLVVGQVFNVFFGVVGVLLTMTDNGNLAAKSAAVAVIANIALNTVLIPVLGVVGAATASMFTLFLWNILITYFVYRKLDIRATIVG